jgi:hypothetical protein
LPDPDTTPLDPLARAQQHLLREEHGTVARGLGAHLGAAPAHPLAGQHTGLVALRDATVLAEEEADLAAAHSDVARGDVGVLADVMHELGHEPLAEAHHLGIALAARIEVGPALAAADALRGERVLEDLLEPEELDDREVHRRVEAQTALIGPERGVELHSEAAVHPHESLVVRPRHPEDQLPLRLDEPFEDPALHELGVLGEHGFQRFEHFAHGLQELGLALAAVLDDLCDRAKVGFGGGQ